MGVSYITVPRGGISRRNWTFDGDYVTRASCSQLCTLVRNVLRVFYDCSELRDLLYERLWYMEDTIKVIFNIAIGIALPLD